MCGLASYVGEDYNSLLFKIVALAQDERGRDNAGIGYLSKFKDELLFRAYLGGTEEERVFKNSLNRGYIGPYPAYPAKTLAELLGDHTTLPAAIHNTIFAHSRKATIGDSTARNAQPFITENIMFMHNGTIINHRTIAEAYKIDGYTSDSQLIALMIVRGYMEDIFTLYEGPCTCMWVDINDPDAYYVFCGSDKHYATTPPEPKKPLYYLETEMGVYSSSNKRALEIISELINSPEIAQSSVKEYSSNYLYRVTKDGAEKVKFYSRQIRKPETQSQQEVAPYKATPQKHIQLLEEDLREAKDKFETDIVSYGAGKYYLNGKVLTTQWTIDNDGEITYYPIYVSKNTFIAYKKLKDQQYVTYKGGQDCEEKLENLVAVPFMEGTLLKSWQHFFDLCRDYAAISLKKLAEASAIPINTSALQKDLKSFYFIWDKDVINATIYIPFSNKRYQFTKNVVTDILQVSTTFALKMSNRYVSKLLKAAAPKEDPEEVNFAQKFRIFTNVMARVRDNEEAPTKYRKIAREVVFYLKEHLGYEND